MLPLFAAIIFVSSTLVFLIQPLFARMVLPQLGGSPAVWNTAMLFYQGILLAGYAYAHFSLKWLGPRRQSLLHLVVVLLPLAVLPIALPHGWSPPTEGSPVAWLLALFGVAIGLPYFAVTTTNPLFQRYFSTVGHRDSGDPYFLYAASNVGSILALLAYPVLVEPWLPLAAQGWLWTAGYGLLVLLIFAAVLLVRRRNGTTPAPPPVEAPLRTLRPTAWQQARWVLLAFVPSSLMLSVTTYITTDLAAAPMLWVVPLTLYLVTFIIVFGRKTQRLVPFFERAFPIGLVALVMVLAMGSTRPLGLMVGLHLTIFFVIATVCHGRMAAERPHPDHLTAFYLWMSVGGVLGGICNALVAPLLFDSLAEYPLVIVVAALIASPRFGETGTDTRRRVLDWVAPLLLGLTTALLVLVVEQIGLAATPPGLLICFGFPTFVSYFFSRRPLRFGLAIGVLLAASLFYGENQDQLLTERSFYGIHRVSYDPQTNRHQLAHGNTLHGQQSLDPKLAAIPMAYYHPSGPIGQIFQTLARPDSRIAAVGLGAGALATYAREGQEWTFYEIDPVVARIASDPRYFTYLADAPVDIRVQLGDARIALNHAPDAAYDIIVLDAYTSDAIPMHLATREALALYLRKLAPHGILAFHLSNQHLKLPPILGNLARDAGIACFYQHDRQVTPQQEKEGKEESQWLVMARDRADLLPLLRRAEWQPEKGNPDQRVWTDDYGSILQAFQ